MTSSDLFESVYRGESVYGKRPPWEIERPQPAFVAIEEAGLVKGDVFDPGCGTGETSLYLASKGHTVTGVDFSATAIATARRKAEERGLDVTFEVADILEDGGKSGLYDTVIDSGTARMFDSETLATYAAALHRLCRPGAYAYVLALTQSGMEDLTARLAEEIDGIPKEVPKDDEGTGGLSLTFQHIPDGFSRHWTVESVTDSAVHYILPSETTETLQPASWLYRFRRI
uniref:Putative SAM-dependent methyltransferase n=1 Tax=Streptomyces sp. SNA15896 TaxID=497689 RepID=D2KTX7_9ACTN|nr:putative SAM-dependent methyltransferase [Streptomyces sp. SNA15896]